MNKWERRKYIQDLYEQVESYSILVINNQGQLQRIHCPFEVIVRKDIHALSKGQRTAVKAVKTDPDTFLDIYVIDGRAYYGYNFIVVVS